MTRDGALSSRGGKPAEPQLVNPAIWQFCGKTLSLIFFDQQKGATNEGHRGNQHRDVENLIAPLMRLGGSGCIGYNIIRCLRRSRLHIFSHPRHYDQ